MEVAESKNKKRKLKNFKDVSINNDVNTKTKTKTNANFDLLNAVSGGKNDVIADDGAPAVQEADAPRDVVDVGVEGPLLNGGVGAAHDALGLLARGRCNVMQLWLRWDSVANFGADISIC